MSQIPISTKEAAKRCGMTPEALTYHIRKNVNPPPHQRVGRDYLFNVETLMEWNRLRKKRRSHA